MREVAAEEEDEEIRKILEDEQIQLLDESERASVSFLDALTGCPRADDVIQFAIPVCAPLSALNNYKYVHTEITTNLYMYMYVCTCLGPS